MLYVRGHGLIHIANEEDASINCQTRLGGKVKVSNTTSKLMNKGENPLVLRCKGCFVGLNRRREAGEL